MTVTLNGLKFRKEHTNQLQKYFNQHKSKLLIVQTTNDKDDDLYVKNKVKYANKLNVDAEIFKSSIKNAEQEIINKIKQIVNTAKKTHNIEKLGVIIQQPSPININNIFTKEFINTDVEGVSDLNYVEFLTAKSTNDEPNVMPCTAIGMIDMLNEYITNNLNQSIKEFYDGKNVLVIGRSQIVGQPIANMFIHRNSTVTIAHSHTKNLNQLCNQANIIVSAAGIPNLVTTAKENAIVLDAGINFFNGKLCGDLSQSLINSQTLAAYTPTPKGTGPVTVYELLNNLSKLKRIDK